MKLKCREIATKDNTAYPVGYTHDWEMYCPSREEAEAWVKKMNRYNSHWVVTILSDKPTQTSWEFEEL